MKPTKKERKTLTTVLIVVGVTTLLFMAAMILIYCRFQSVPDVLIERYFTCVIGELGISGIIQVAKMIVEWLRGRN